MKNYLFEPFKNDEIKTYFNELKNNLDIYGLTMFVGRLEAYYDVIISKLKAENEELKVDNERLNDKDGLYDEVKELQEEYDELQKELKNSSSVGYMELLTKSNDKLKAENKRLQDELQAVNNDYNNDNKVHDEYEDGLLEEIKELKNKLSNYNCGCKYPKELKADAEEYFDNNPHEEKVFYFVVGGSGCEKDGDVKNSLNSECDAVAEFDNNEGIISGEVYK